MWLTIHESVGHPTELDRVLGYEANYAGTSFATLDKRDNKFQYGSDKVTIVADKIQKGSLGAVGYDDEGVKTRQYVNALIAGSMLANQGHQVERVADGSEAVRRALREIDRPDLVLMDCLMPVMDGFEATRSIRTQEVALGLRRVPIIALSAIIDEETGRKSIDAGMDDALGKPFSSEDLRRVIRPWLALRESERQGVLDGVTRGGSVDEDGSS